LLVLHGLHPLDLASPPGNRNGACEILGLDLLYVVNEEKSLIVANKDVDPALAALRSQPLSKNAAVHRRSGG